jgi:hypothetical protein
MIIGKSWNIEESCDGQQYFLAGRDGDFPFAGYLLSILPTPQQALTQTAALQDFAPANDRLGSISVIRRCRLKCPVCPKADTAGRFMSL